MAGKFLRHARAKGIWGTQPARSDEVRTAAAVDPQPARRAPGRKDTRHFCRGKAGREHVPEIVMTPQPFYTGVPGGECGWTTHWSVRQRAYDGVRWSCRHEERCASCGKVLRCTGQLTRAECPSYPGAPEQKAEAEAEAAARQERYSEWYRRPVIDGPQGYRRKRQDAS
jgi:hypothetical protein